MCAAVCLANPASRKVVSYSKNNPRCTVVLVNNTLVGQVCVQRGSLPLSRVACTVTPHTSVSCMPLTSRLLPPASPPQWTDELRKFAPHLKLGRGYGSRRAFTQEYLDSIDVLVTTPHSGLGLGRKTSSLGGDVVGHVRRLVLDESHLYEKGAEPKMPTTKVFTQWRAKFVWCVTGTPFSTQLVQLETQARILGQWEGGFKLSTILACSPYQSSLYKSNDEVVDMLREVMIRHSKSQRIKGEVALALPESECNTAWLTFSRSERVLYALHGCADGEWPCMRTRCPRRVTIAPCHAQRRLVCPPRRSVCACLWVQGCRRGRMPTVTTCARSTTSPKD